MSEEQRRIQELEEQVQELHKLLWMHVELSTKASNLIAELSRQRKPGVEENGTIVRNDIELIAMPSTCFSVKLQEVTLRAIDEALEQAYLRYRANPHYLFCSKQNGEQIDGDVLHNTNVCGPQHLNTKEMRVTRLCNQTTGRLMWVIILPEIEDGTLVFGF